MITIQERYLVNPQGQKLYVCFDFADYQKILQELEELEFLRGTSKVPNLKQSVKELLDEALVENHPTTFTVARKVFVAVVPRQQTELSEQLKRCVTTTHANQTFVTSNVSYYDDSEIAVRSTNTPSVSTQPTLREVLDQVNRQKEPQWVNYQDQLFLVIGSLAEEDLLSALEDCIDNANADEALKEDGAISLEDLIGELGLCVTP